jgi:hypothetical protein
MCFMLQKLGIIVTAITLCLANYCYAEWPEDWGEVSTQEWVMGAPAEYPEANALIIFDRGSLEIISGTLDLQYVFRRHVRMKPLTSAGVEEIAQVEIPWQSEEKWHASDSIRAHTIRSDGSIQEVSANDIHIKTVEDVNIASFAFPNVDTGAVVEYCYEFVGDPVDVAAWYFHNKIFTLESQLSVEFLAHEHYVYLTMNMPSWATTPLHQTRQQRLGVNEVTVNNYTWLLNDLPPIKEEPYMTCVEDYRAALHIRPRWPDYFLQGDNVADRWSKLGYPFDKFVLKDFLKRPREFKKQVKAVVKGCNTAHAKALAIYRFVVDSIVTRIIGDGLSKEHKNLAQVWKERFGTPIEKNLVLLEMLRSANIKAWPVLICSRNHARFNPRWLEFDQFDRVLVFAEVEEGGIYLDASTKYCPFGTLRPSSRVDVGLLIDSDRSELVKIFTNDPKSDRIDLTSMWILGDGQVACTTKCMLRGYMADEYGSRFEMSKSESFIWEDLLKDARLRFSPVGYSAKLDSMGRFMVEAYYSADESVEELGSNLQVSVPCFMFRSNPFQSERRFTPIDFGYSFSYEHIVHIYHDTSLSASWPADTSVQSEGLEFTRLTTTESGHSVVSCKLTVQSPFFAVVEYDRVRRFFQLVATLNDVKVQLAASSE